MLPEYLQALSIRINFIAALNLKLHHTLQIYITTTREKGTQTESHSELSFTVAFAAAYFVLERRRAAKILDLAMFRIW